MNQELTLPYLKITPREDLTEHQRNLIEDIIVLGLDIKTYHGDNEGNIFISLDENEESEDGIIVSAFRLGVAYERLELRYGIQEPFMFTKIVDEDEGDYDYDDKRTE